MKDKIRNNIIVAALLIFALALQIIVPASGATASTDESDNPDPNFHIYIAFGQSNMEGHAPAEEQDMTVDENYLMMQTAEGMRTADGRKKKVGKWYPAVPKLANINTVGIGVCDYFGRSMLEIKKETNPDAKVGVIVVAVAGASIKVFDKDKYKEYLEDEGTADWLRNIAKQYGSNPYQRIIDVAKLAQKDGVIKGIIMHQGETDAASSYWTDEVKKIYGDMVTDLGLSDNIPLLAGECLQNLQEQNNNINKLPNLNSNFHVVSSKGFRGESDGLHFTAADYREYGARYAELMAKVEPQYTFGEPVYEWSADNTSVTAKRVCNELPFYVEEETVSVTKEVKDEMTEPDPIVPSHIVRITVYTSDDFKNPAFTRQTKTEKIDIISDSTESPKPDDGDSSDVQEEKPTETPTIMPTSTPSAEPTEAPVTMPTSIPSAEPTEEPNQGNKPAVPTQVPTPPKENIGNNTTGGNINNVSDISKTDTGTQTETQATDANKSQTADSVTVMTLKLKGVKCIAGSKKITGKVSLSKAKVKIKVGSRAYKKATVKGKKFTLRLGYKLRKNTKVTIKVTKKGCKGIVKQYKVKQI